MKFLKIFSFICLSSIWTAFASQSYEGLPKPNENDTIPNILNECCNEKVYNSAGENMQKCFGIVTTGGDCSGLNSAILAAYRRTKELGNKLVGIKRGFSGFINGNIETIQLNDSNCNETFLTLSGSSLVSDTKSFSNNDNHEFPLEKIKQIIAAGYQQLGLDGLICIGGDGSATLLSKILVDNNNIKFVLIPKTIDNDVNKTNSIGSNTAVNVVRDAILNIRTTAQSHERVFVVEVMGRDAGYLAMNAGVSAIADAILVPEFKFDIQQVKKTIDKCYERGQNYSIIVVAESVSLPDDEFAHDKIHISGAVSYTKTKYNNIGNKITDKLKALGCDAKSVVLGHIQRGGNTTVDDTLLALSFGNEAVNRLIQGHTGELLCFDGNKIEALKLSGFGGNFTRCLTKNDLIVRTAHDLGIYIGETHTS